MFCDPDGPKNLQLNIKKKKLSSRQSLKVAFGIKFTLSIINSGVLKVFNNDRRYRIQFYRFSQITKDAKMQAFAIEVFSTVSIVNSKQVYN